MGHRWRLIAFGAVALGAVLGPVIVGTAPDRTAGQAPTLTLTLMASGLQSPVDLTHAGDSRIFIVEQAGRIRVYKNGSLLQAPFLDITGQVATGGEQGLLGLVFSPGYGANGRFYVYLTNTEGHIEIRRYTVPNPAADTATGSAVETLLVIDALPFTNHNGGQLAFHNGQLWFAPGDGGGSGCPSPCPARDDSSLLGKVVRMAVETGDGPYTPVIVHKGLRNPWRFSFSGGQLYIADVGQGSREEVNIVSAGATGTDFGWNIMEGSLCFPPGSNCSSAGLHLPQIEYGHTGGRCAITGGYVYTANRFPSMTGRYFYADYCSGEVWGGAGGPVSTDLRITSFGKDQAGNLYVVGSGAFYLLGEEGSTPTSTPTAPPTASPTVAPASATPTATPSATPTSTPPIERGPHRAYAAAATRNE